MSFVDQVHQVNIISQQNFLGIDPPLKRSVFQFEDAPWTNCRAYTTAHAAGPNDILPFLRIGPHIYALFAIRGAIATGNALSPIGGNPKTGLKTLYKT
jgi:hypothetical protein